MKTCGGILAFFAVSTAVAQQWTAHEWSGAPAQNWSFNSGNQTITVSAPGAYKFFATSGPLASDPLAAINNVSAPGVPGTVTVSIVRSPATGGGPGCTDLGAFDLAGATDSIVPELRVQNDAATVAGLSFRKLTGPFAVGGAITHAVNISTAFGGALTCTSLGNFTATTDSGSPSITVTNSDANRATLNAGIEQLAQTPPASTPIDWPAVYEALTGN